MAKYELMKLLLRTHLELYFWRCMHTLQACYCSAESGRVTQQQLPASGPKAALDQNGTLEKDFKPVNQSVAAPRFQPEALD